MKSHIYDVTKDSDLQKLYWEYAVNKLFDSIAYMQRADIEIESVRYCRSQMQHRKNALHEVKDILYDILIVTYNDHILDLIYTALCSDKPETVEDFYFVISDTLQNSFELLNDVESAKYKMFMSHLKKKWPLVGREIGARAKCYLDCEVLKLEMSGM